MVAHTFITLVLNCGASFRCAAKVLDLFASVLGLEGFNPDRSTGRLWLLRIGLAALLRPKTHADDWVWMVDHSIQIGQCKCMVVLGIRQCDLPVDRALVHQDMEPIALVPMISSTKYTVAECLENAVAQTGVPRAILDDHGADLHGGVDIFCKAHPTTIELYDIKHKAACLLKARLEKDPRWQAYCSQVGKTKFAIQQTALAFLTPPSQRSKARFMNVDEVVAWGVGTLALMDDPAKLATMGISAEQLKAKLGWLEEYRLNLSEWSSLMDVIAKTLDFVRCHGLTSHVGGKLDAVLPAMSGSASELREQLLAFVTDESSKIRQGERLLGTTEVLESCFGKLKMLEDGQSKSGFTGLVLSLGAMVSKWTAENIGEAMKQCRVRDVVDWCRSNLGPSIQSQRRQAYSSK